MSDSGNCEVFLGKCDVPIAIQQMKVEYGGPELGGSWMSGIRLIIMDDDPGIREALRTLANDLGADVLAEADNGRAAIEHAELHRAELMLLDVSMPVMGGIPAAKYLREHMPDLQIILISQYNRKVYADEAMQLGVKGYIVKAAVATELGPAMQTVMNGGTFISPHIGN
jgi:DNA-binding NarL/FixJ family response regulator